MNSAGRQNTYLGHPHVPAPPRASNKLEHFEVKAYDLPGRQESFVLVAHTLAQDSWYESKQAAGSRDLRLPRRDFAASPTAPAVQSSFSQSSCLQSQSLGFGAANEQRVGSAVRPCLIGGDDAWHPASRWNPAPSTLEAHELLKTKARISRAGGGASLFIAPKIQTLANASTVFVFMALRQPQMLRSFQRM